MCELSSKLTVMIPEWRHTMSISNVDVDCFVVCIIDRRPEDTGFYYIETS